MWHLIAHRSWRKLGLVVVVLVCLALQLRLYRKLSSAENGTRTTRTEDDEEMPIKRSSATDKVALIIIAKAHPLIPVVVKNVLSILPNEWKVQIFHSIETTQFLKESDLNFTGSASRLIYTPTIPGSLSYDGYGELFKSLDFWHLVQGEHVLVFQMDSVLCSKSAHTIDEFLKYDYIGAPWKDDFELQSGNGGLSLRRKSVMMQALSHCTQVISDETGEEDIWFSFCFRRLRGIWGDNIIKLPGREQAKKFSVETVFYNRPFGTHKPWLYFENDQLDELSHYCPELLLILPPEGQRKPSPPPEEPPVERRWGLRRQSRPNWPFPQRSRHHF